MIHHVGIVCNINQRDALLDFYRRFLGPLRMTGSKTIKEWECDCYMYRPLDGETQLEFVVPQGGKLLTWLQEKGTTLHHMAVQVPNLRAACRALIGAGVVLVSPEPVEGVNGILVNFIHPRHLGVLIELVQV